MRSYIFAALALSLSSVSGFSIQSSVRFTSLPLYSTAESSTPAPAAEVSAPAPAEASPPATESAPAASAPAEAAKTEGPSNNQAAYGKTKDMPGTYVRCGRCATSYALAADDLGGGKGLRIGCGLCGHSWFQTPERLFTLNSGHELVPLPPTEVTRINSNIEKGREPDFLGNLKFYVGNLDFGVQASDLRSLFSEVGEVGAVDIVTGPDGRSKGFAFVTMMEEELKMDCMNLDGTELLGRSINVKEPNN
jgi:predicted Zn finger-like uncharacterized protein